MLTLSAAALSAAALSAAALSNRACTEETQQRNMLRAQKMRANYLLSAPRLLRLDSLLRPRLLNNRKYRNERLSSPSDPAICQAAPGPPPFWSTTAA